MLVLADLTTPVNEWEPGAYAHVVVGYGSRAELLPLTLL
jgi:hypothetical protein